MFYTTEELLTSIKVRSLVPTAQQTFDDSSLILLSNEELQISLLPDLISLREDLFLSSKTTPIVAGVSHYTVPERAAGNALKAVTYVDQSGWKRALPRGKVEDFTDSATRTGDPRCFMLQGDEVVLIPTPGNSVGGLELWYYSRPNQLVETGNVSKITDVTSVGGTTTFTVDTDLSGSLLVGSLVDILSAKSPFLLWGEDLVVTGITTSTISVSTSSVSNPASQVLPKANDYISPAQKANIPMIPQEFHPILAQMVAARLMEALGDMGKLQAVNAKLSEMRRQAFQMISNRVESELQHVVKRHGILSAIRR